MQLFLGAVLIILRLFSKARAHLLFLTYSQNNFPKPTSNTMMQYHYCTISPVQDVFTSPSHSQRTSTSSSVSPSHGKQQRDHLSTTASDDVFVSPVHAAAALPIANQSTAEESTDGGSSELDAVKRSESTLEHVNSDINYCPSYCTLYTNLQFFCL